MKEVAYAFNPKDIERFEHYKKYCWFKWMIQDRKIIVSDKIKEFRFSGFDRTGKCISRGVIPEGMRKGR